jgi:hypothetical protein
MKAVAKRLKTGPVKLTWTSLEKKASKMVPTQTTKVKADGYRGYRELINNVPEEQRKKYTYQRGDIASTAELQLLIDGKRSVLEIKQALDAQYPNKSDLQSVINYIEILQLAGLVKM